MSAREAARTSAEAKVGGTAMILKGCVAAWRLKKQLAAPSVAPAYLSPIRLWQPCACPSFVYEEASLSTRESL